MLAILKSNRNIFTPFVFEISEEIISSWDAQWNDGEGREIVFQFVFVFIYIFIDFSLPPLLKFVKTFPLEGRMPPN